VKVYLQKYYDGELQKSVKIPGIQPEMLYGIDPSRAYKALEKAQKIHGHQMSANAKRRIELYQEALEFFVPSLFEPQSTIKTQPTKSQPSAPAMPPIQYNNS
jgi:hypothetical protein